MADFYILEFKKLAEDVTGKPVHVGSGGGVATKLTGTSATPQSHTFDTNTRFVEIHSSGAAHHFTLGGGAAGTSDMVLPDGATSFRGKGGATQISVRTA